MGKKNVPKKGKRFNMGEKLRIGMLVASFVLMLIALLLFATVVRKDIVKMAVNISPDGFKALVEELEKVKDKLPKLDNVNGKISNPIRFRRGLPEVQFDVAIRPLTVANLNDLDRIQILGGLIKIFANIVLNLLTFPLLALVLLTIVACFLYLCKIFGRLFCYLAAVGESAPANKSSGFLRCLSIIRFLLSYVQEFMWGVAVILILLALFLVYVGAGSLQKRGDWKNCWLGLLTIDFTPGEGVLRVQIAAVFAFIAIALNLIDQIVNTICPATCRCHVIVARDQNKDE